MNPFTICLSKGAPRRLATTLGAVAALAGLLVVAGPGLAPPAAASPSLSGARAQAAAAAARLNALDAQMARQDEQLDQAQSRLTSLNAQLAAARKALAAAQATVAAKRATLKAAAVAAYVQGGQTSGIVQLMQSSQSEADVRQGYLASVADAQQGAIDSFHSALVAYQARQSRLAGAQAAAQAAVSQIRSARDASAAAAAREHAELSSLNSQVSALVTQIEAQQAAVTAASFAGRYAGAASRSAGFSSSGPLPPAGAGASAAVEWAQREIGKPYVYGAAGPDSFDCSGLTMYVWERAGVSLPHSAAGQWDDTTRVPISDLQPGDLVFYYEPVDHVGIYVGGGQMIVADHTGTNVRYASIFRDGLDGGGRVG